MRAFEHDMQQREGRLSHTVCTAISTAVHDSGCPAVGPRRARDDDDDVLLVVRPLAWPALDVAGGMVCVMAPSARTRGGIRLPLGWTPSNLVLFRLMIERHKASWRSNGKVSSQSRGRNAAGVGHLYVIFSPTRKTCPKHVARRVGDVVINGPFLSPCEECSPTGTTGSHS